MKVKILRHLFINYVTNCQNEKIVWAYDDFQNIFNVKIQDERATFGKNENGKYNVDFDRDNLPNQDIVLKNAIGLQDIL